MLPSFGVQEELKGWTSSRLNKAVGLWLRDGSLVLHAWQDHRCSVEQQVLADLKSYQPQTWARDFATKATAEHAKVSASFSSDRMLVAGAVTLMERSDGS